MVKKNFTRLFKDYVGLQNKINIKLTDRPQNISVDKFLTIVKEYENQSN